MDHLVITCEHAGNDVPDDYRHLFVGMVQHLLPTHRGWDPGALILAREMAERFAAPLYFDTTTRLLVDLNRSVGTPSLHSEPTRGLPFAERRRILERFYHPHRRRTEGAIGELIEGGARVVHIASHSFTPELDGHVRTADIGLLYDPARAGEVAFCDDWLEALGRRDPALRLRRNYPYLGTSDGLTFAMRKRHPADRYIGIEIEVNQRYVEADGPEWLAVRRTVVDAMADVLAGTSAFDRVPVARRFARSTRGVG